jgi:uncharacterized protein YybS (DUF2232 family)
MWACPDRLVWGLIAAGFLLLTRVPPLVTISLNLLIILLTIYFLQGVAIISFWFKKKNLPMGLRVLGYIMIGLVQFLPFVVAAVGLFDIWGDFRKMRPKWQPKQ